MRERARRKKDEQRFCPAFRGGFPAEADVQSTLRFIKFARGGFPARGAGDGVPAWVWDEVPTYNIPVRSPEERRAKHENTVR